MSTPQVIAYTDGGCRGNPGVGAWAFVIIDAASGKALEQADALADTTNNRMELTAVLKVLQSLTRPGISIEIRSDSKYTIDSCATWMPGWKRKGWKRKGGPLKNVDILKELDAVLQRHQVSFKWVKGHAGDPGNEHVDSLLNDAMDRLQGGSPGTYDARLNWPHRL